MPVLKLHKTPAKEVRNGIQPKIIHTHNLISVVLGFADEPLEPAEPPHNHLHAQTPHGEITFYGQSKEDKHLKAGDTFVVPSARMHINVLTPNVRLVNIFNPLRDAVLIES